MRDVNIKIIISPNELRNVASLMESYKQVQANWYGATVTFINENNLDGDELAAHKKPTIRVPV